MCRSNTQADVEGVQESTEAEVPFLGAIGSERRNPWAVTISLKKKPVKFQIDSGAEVTVVPDSMLRKLTGVNLKPTQRTLKGSTQGTLPVRGQFRGTLVFGDREVQQDIYVVKKLLKPLLGQPAIEALNLLVRVGTVADGTEIQNPVQRFPQLFHGLGRMQGDYAITLKEGAVPFALTTPCRVPIPLMSTVKAELENVERLGVISRMDTPTDWCAGMVVVPKSNNRVRICVDLTKLNESVRRERRPMPAAEQTLAQIAGARVFSKLDVNSGFWQIPLSAESAALTTFVTPFGRYHFNRLPFGITSAPEHFLRRIQEVLHDLQGVVCLMDDVLVHGKTQSEHDQCLNAVLVRLTESGLTLNMDKCLFTAAGQILTPSGISSDPDKVSAVRQMRQPTSVSEVHRFLGMANQLSKFVPKLADLTKPMRDLLSKRNHWAWGEPQQRSFTQVQDALTKSPVLASFDPNLETIVSADASSFGLGAVPLKKQKSGEIRPVAYISRAMTPTEQRYAQTEKESLALTWACERFQDYLVGLQFHAETDHKPLVSLFGRKLLHELPLRVQRFRMRLMRFNFTTSHFPGKYLSTADTLSRAPISNTTPRDELTSEDVDAYIQMAVQSLPATESRLESVRLHQESDSVCKQVVSYCLNGWPKKSKIQTLVKPFYSVAGELTIQDGLLMRGSRLVISTEMQAEVLTQLHASHQGISKSRLRARQSVWWPGMSADLEKVVRSCTECAKSNPPRPEPLLSTPLPTLPWQRVGRDLFEWKGATYLLIVDYFSRWIEIAKLQPATSSSVIGHMQSIFARYGIPEVIVSDNGPQYSSEVFSQFARDYGFKHVTSSPHYPQANGEAERAVKTVKALLRESKRSLPGSFSIPLYTDSSWVHSV